MKLTDVGVTATLSLALGSIAASSSVISGLGPVLKGDAKSESFTPKSRTYKMVYLTVSSMQVLHTYFLSTTPFP